MSAQSCVLTKNTASPSNSELLIVLSATNTFKDAFNDRKISQVLVLSKKWITKHLYELFNPALSHAETTWKLLSKIPDPFKSTQKRLATVLQTHKITNKNDICALLWLILEVIQKLCGLLCCLKTYFTNANTMRVELHWTFSFNLLVNKI